MFKFEDSADLLGTVVMVDTGEVVLDVADPRQLTEARVGMLVALRCVTQVWLVGMVRQIIKRYSNISVLEESDARSGDAIPGLDIGQENRVRVVLVGTVLLDGSGNFRFHRALRYTPSIEAGCYLLRGTALEVLMHSISATTSTTQALEIGHYSLDEQAKALLNGDRFFQRHAAIVGSTGSGKSYAVARLLEEAAKLPSANIVLFDLHGEYGSLSYAQQFRIAGPDELDSCNQDVIFLPYWLLNADELQSFFIDRSEFSAHNQVMAFISAVLDEKRSILEAEKKREVLASFTIDSPIPYSLDAVIARLIELNDEMTQGSRGLKQGQFYAQFSRLITRLESKRKDRRYGFLLQAPKAWQGYDALHRLAQLLMDFALVSPSSNVMEHAPPARASLGNGIKVIDFSEVPSDILPLVVGMVARLIYQVQFWMPAEKRQPIALVCDEAHRYVPRPGNLDPVEERALEDFERIAKEGRKYGVSLVVVSQRPADVSETILSQCNNFIALRLSNPADQDIVRRLMPDHLQGLMDSLPMLDVGEAVVVGDAVLLPSRVRLTPPSAGNRPNSATIDFWSAWSKNEHRTDPVLAVENLRRQSRRP